MKKKINGRMFGAGLLILMLMMISFSSVFGVDIIQSGTQNTELTFIKNSNGNIYEATCSGLQSAVDNLDGEGGKIWIPDATFTFSSWLDTLQLDGNNDNLSIEGTGHTGWDNAEAGTTFLLSGNCNIMNLTGTSGNRIHGVKLKNIKFLSDRSVNGDAINITHGTDIDIEECWFRGINGSAVSVASCWSMRFDDCNTFQCGNDATGKPVLLFEEFEIKKNTDVIIQDTIFEENYYTDIYFGQSQSSKILNNHFEAYYGQPYMIYGSVAQGLIQGNNFWDEDGTVDAIYSSGFNTKIIVNDISDTDYGIWVGPNAKRNIISNNNIRNTTRFGINVLCSYGATIEGNTLFGCGTQNSHGSIYLNTNGHNCLVDGNTVIDPYGVGIYVESDYNTVCNNKIYEKDENNLVNGIRLHTTSDNNSIFGNEINGFSSNGVSDVGNNNIVFYNTIDEQLRTSTDTYIRNSNGKYWTASWSNFEQALWDLNNTGGEIWTPSDTTLSATNRLEVEHGNITIHMCSKIIIPDGYTNTSFFWDTNKGSIIRLNAENCTIDGHGIGLIDTIGTVEESNEALHNNIHSIAVFGDRCDVKNIIVKNAMWCGIYLRNSNDCIIENNKIINSHDSNIYLSNNNNRNKILKNRIYSFNSNNRTEHGIKVAYSSSNNIVDGNTIDFNDNADVGGGIIVEQNAYNNTISNNHIMNGNSATAIAIACRTNSIERSNDFIGNHIYNWAGDGIWVDEPCRIIGGNIVDCDKTGIEINGNHVLVDGVYLRGIGERGIEIKTSTNATVINCDIEDCVSGGIFIGTGSQTIDTPIVKNNRVSGSSTNYYIHPSATVTNSIVKDNIRYDDSTYLILPDESNAIERFLRYDDTNNQLEVYDDSSWVEFNAGTGVGYDPTLIWNSNGNNWTATGANIQLAINDLDNSSGTVWLPGNTTFAISSTIQLYKNIIFDMGGAEIKANGNFDIISVHENAQLKNGQLNCSGIAGYSSACIKLDGANKIGHTWYWYDPFGHTHISNMYLKGTQIMGQHPSWLNGTGILVECNALTTEYVVGVVCNNIDMKDLEYGIRFDATGGVDAGDNDNYANSNYFEYIWMINVREGIYLDRNESETTVASSIWGNKFLNFINEFNFNSDRCLYAEGNFNEFDICCWDHNLGNTTTELYNLTTDTTNCRLKLMGGTDDWVDDGTDNWIDDMGGSYQIGGDFSIDLSDISGVNYINRLDADPDTVRFFFQDSSGDTTLGTYGLNHDTSFEIVCKAGGPYLQWNNSQSLYVHGGNGDYQDAGGYLWYEGNSDVHWFHATDSGETPKHKIYGRNADDSANARLDIYYSNGNGTFSTSDGNILMIPNDGSVNVTGDIYCSGNFLGDGSQLTGMTDYDPTLIWNSNGNNWTATDANIQLAIDDLAGIDNGWVKTPGNTVIELDQTIYVNNCSLYMYGTTFNVTADVNVFEPIKNEYQWDGINMEIAGATVDVSWLKNQGGDYTKAVVYIHTKWTWYQNNLLHIHDMIMSGDDFWRTGGVSHCMSGGTGIELYGATGGNCYCVRVDNCVVSNLKHGIWIHNDGGGDYGMTGNIFESVYIMDCELGYVIEGTGYMDGNKLTNFQIQGDSPMSEEAIRICKGEKNYVEGMIWDYSQYANQSSIVNITSGAVGTVVKIPNLDRVHLTDTQTLTSNKGSIETATSLEIGYINLTGHSGANPPDSAISTSHINPNGHWGYHTSVPNWYTFIYNFVPDGTTTFIRQYGGNTGEYMQFKVDTVTGTITTNGLDIVLDPPAGKFVGINKSNPAYELDVTGDIHCTGKLTSDGGNDPPYVLFNKETLLSITERINKEIPKNEENKWDGQAIFYDSEQDNMFLINPKTGETREFVWKSDFDKLEERLEKLELLVGEILEQ